MLTIEQNKVAELSFSSANCYADAFNDVELDIVFTDQAGSSCRVPAFWAGGDIWKVRFSSSTQGAYTYSSICSDTANEGLHGLTGSLEVVAYTGRNPLYVHGPIMKAPDRQHFQHADGTPFFWLADTWWMGLSSRLEWPDEFQWLTRDRAEKGFNVVQIVAGLYPDMPAFDERAFNEAGYAWEEDFARVNPDYFDYADRRIQHLVESGIVPCIVGAWGYYTEWTGVEKMKKHWRYIIARYGAYPVAWCASGETSMPYYLNPKFWDRKELEPQIRADWTEITGYMRSTDPFHRPISVHTVMERTSHNEINDPTLIDFDFIQGGHTGYVSFPGAMKILGEAISAEPKTVAFIGEAVYEGIGEGCHEEVQRLFFWAAFLSGAKAHTYGANGVWQVHRSDRPYGQSPLGGSYDGQTWDAAAKLPGSASLGICKELIDRYDWWDFEPHQEWVEHSPIPALYTPEAGQYFVPYAAGIPGKVMFVYHCYFGYMGDVLAVKGLCPDTRYRAFHYNPTTGVESHHGSFSPDETGRWVPPIAPAYRDWVLVIEAEDEQR